MVIIDHFDPQEHFWSIFSSRFNQNPHQYHWTKDCSSQLYDSILIDHGLFITIMGSLIVTLLSILIMGWWALTPPPPSGFDLWSFPIGGHDLWTWWDLVKSWEIFMRVSWCYPLFINSGLNSNVFELCFLDSHILRVDSLCMWSGQRWDWCSHWWDACIVKGDGEMRMTQLKLASNLSNDAKMRCR